MVLRNKFPQFTIQVTSSKLQGHKLRYLHINFSVRLNKSALWHYKTHLSWNWTKYFNPLLFYDEIWTIYFAIKLFEFVAPYSMFSFIEHFCKVNACKISRLVKNQLKWRSLYKIMLWVIETLSYKSHHGSAPEILNLNKAWFLRWS